MHVVNPLAGLRVPFTGLCAQVVDALTELRVPFAGFGTQIFNRLPGLGAQAFEVASEVPL